MVTELRPKLIGDKIVMRCPLHKENIPSFVLKTTNETYQCLGCQSRGTFVELWEKLDKPKSKPKASVEHKLAVD